MKSIVDSYPPRVRERLLSIRSMILRIAANNDEIGAIEETLKWGEPSYLTSETGSGTTIRLAWKASSVPDLGIYFNCRTSLVDTFRTMFPELRYLGNRAILLDCDQDMPESAISLCLEMALLYHRSERGRRVPHDVGLRP